MYLIFSSLFLSANLFWSQLHRDCYKPLVLYCSHCWSVVQGMSFSDLCFECLHVMRLNPTALCTWNLFCLHTLLVGNRNTPKLSSMLKQKEGTPECSALLALGGQQKGYRHRRGMWYMRLGSFLRRALPWLWKPVDPAVRGRLEEMSAPCECTKWWRMLRYNPLCGKSSQKRFLRPCGKVRAPAQLLTT